MFKSCNIWNIIDKYFLVLHTSFFILSNRTQICLTVVILSLEYFIQLWNINSWETKVYGNWQSRVPMPNNISSSIILISSRYIFFSIENNIYASPSLILSFELNFFVCRHVSMWGFQNHVCLSICLYHEKKFTPPLRQYQSYISNWFINGKVFTSTTQCKPKKFLFFQKSSKFECWLVTKSWNHLSFVNISSILVIDTSMERSSRVLQHRNQNIFFFKKVKIEFWLVLKLWVRRVVSANFSDVLVS